MLTSILPPPGFEPKTQAPPVEASAKVKFKTPFTLETVFGPEPGLEDFRLFTANRGVNLESLSEADKSLWKKSWTENRVLCGYIVFAVVFPAYIKRRTKLRDANTHWVDLSDKEKSKGKSKMEQRQKAKEMMDSMTASSCFRGTSSMIHPDILVWDFLGLERNDLFLTRDFTPNSSAHASCAAILSHLWFSTTVLGRPCSLDSVVVPIRGEETTRLAHLGITGKVSAFQVDWKHDVFSKLPGYFHDNIAGLFLERLTSDSHVDVYPSDVFLLYKARLKGGSGGSVGAMSSAHNLVVVPCFDTLLSNTDSCQLDALDLSAISLDFGEEAASQVKATGTVGVFSASMGRKMSEAIKVFSESHLLVRRSVNNRMKIIQCQDPGGMKKKLAGGRLLDPRVKHNVDAVKDMIRQISAMTWTPVKSMLFKLVDGLNPDMDDVELCTAFLKIGGSSGDEFRRKAHGVVTQADVSNVCFLLFLTMSFQRSQVLRDSTLSEYIPTRDGVGYTLSIERAIKTTGSNNDGYSPMRQFDLTPSQSLMVHFIKIVGHRRGDQRLLVNERGGDMTQSNLGARFKAIGKAYLGLPNLSPHCMRTFFASHLVDSGLVSEKDLNEIGSFLQVSSKTLRTAYIASSTNTASHKIGKRALGDVMDSGGKSKKTPKMSSETTFDVGSRPMGKHLAKARDVYRDDILRSVKAYKDPVECFKALVQHREEGCLKENDKWFQFSKSYFSDSDCKFFVRFVRSRS